MSLEKLTWKFSNDFIEFCGLGGVRTWWCSWIHVHAYCGGCGLEVIGHDVSDMLFMSLFIELYILRLKKGLVFL